MRTALAVLALAVTAAPALAQDPAPGDAPPSSGFLLEPTTEEKLVGAVDLCVRWQPSDPAHLTDVVMTNSSGDKDLDSRIPGMVREIPFPRPQDDNGEWFGLNLSFGAAEPHKSAPDCAQALRPAGGGN